MFMTRNQFENIIAALSFTDILPSYFKDRFFEISQMIFAWNDHMKDVFTPFWVSCLD